MAAQYTYLLALALAQECWQDEESCQHATVRPCWRLHFCSQNDRQHPLLTQLGGCRRVQPLAVHNRSWRGTLHLEQALNIPYKCDWGLLSLDKYIYAVQFWHARCEYVSLAGQMLQQDKIVHIAIKLLTSWHIYGQGGSTCRVNTCEVCSC